MKGHDSDNQAIWGGKPLTGSDKLLHYELVLMQKASHTQNQTHKEQWSYIMAQLAKLRAPSSACGTEIEGECVCSKEESLRQQEVCCYSKDFFYEVWKRYPVVRVES